MNRFQIEQYDPRMFRRWHNGPVIILDSMKFGNTMDTGHAKYLAVQFAINTTEIVKNIPRPFAGTVYVAVPLATYEQLLEQNPDLDIRQLMM